MCNQLVLLVFTLQSMETTKKIVLLSLAERANPKHDDYCCPSHNDTARRTGLTRNTVIKKINELDQEGYISREPTFRSRGGQTQNYYWVNRQKLVDEVENQSKYMDIDRLYEEEMPDIFRETQTERSVLEEEEKDYSDNSTMLGGVTESNGGSDLRFSVNDEASATVVSSAESYGGSIPQDTGGVCEDDWGDNAGMTGGVSTDHSPSNPRLPKRLHEGNMIDNSNQKNNNNSNGNRPAINELQEERITGAPTSGNKVAIPSFISEKQQMVTFGPTTNGNADIDCFQLSNDIDEDQDPNSLPAEDGLNVVGDRVGDKRSDSIFDIWSYEQLKSNGNIENDTFKEEDANNERVSSFIDETAQKLYLFLPDPDMEHVRQEKLIEPIRECFQKGKTEEELFEIIKECAEEERMSHLNARCRFTNVMTRVRIILANECEGNIRVATSK